MPAGPAGIACAGPVNAAPVHSEPTTAIVKASLFIVLVVLIAGRIGMMRRNAQPMRSHRSEAP